MITEDNALASFNFLNDEDEDSDEEEEEEWEETSSSSSQLTKACGRKPKKHSTHTFHLCAQFTYSSFSSHSACYLNWQCMLESSRLACQMVVVGHRSWISYPFLMAFLFQSPFSPPFPFLSTSPFYSSTHVNGHTGVSLS